MEPSTTQELAASRGAPSLKDPLSSEACHSTSVPEAKTRMLRQWLHPHANRSWKVQMPTRWVEISLAATRCQVNCPRPRRTGHRNNCPALTILNRSNTLLHRRPLSARHLGHRLNLPVPPCRVPTMPHRNEFPMCARRPSMWPHHPRSRRCIPRRRALYLRKTGLEVLPSRRITLHPTMVENATSYVAGEAVRCWLGASEVLSSPAFRRRYHCTAPANGILHFGVARARSRSDHSKIPYRWTNTSLASLAL